MTVTVKGRAAEAEAEVGPGRTVRSGGVKAGHFFPAKISSLSVSPSECGRAGSYPVAAAFCPRPGSSLFDRLQPTH